MLKSESIIESYETDIRYLTLINYIIVFDLLIDLYFFVVEFDL